MSKKEIKKCKFCKKCFESYISKYQIYCCRECFKKAKVFIHNKPHSREAKEKNRKAHLGKKIEKLKGHKFWGGKNAKKCWFKKRNGKYTDDKYIKLYLPNHPLANKKGTLREHTKILYDNGVLLNKNEVCHHINFKRDDNRIENLQVLTKSEHTKLHNLRKI